MDVNFEKQDQMDWREFNAWHSYRGMKQAAIALMLSVFCGVISLPLLGPACAMELITEDEASLPADRSESRGITRGPKVLLKWPAQNAGFLHSPIHLKVRFQGFGGNRVDLESVIVTYAKIPAIDLTERVRPYIDVDGIDIDEAVVPPGHHRLQVQVQDTMGRTGMLDFTFDVIK